MCSKKNDSFAAFCRGFGFAGRGIARCLKERNFRFHLMAAVHVFAVARHFVQSAGEWCALLLTVVLVLSLEAVNTAVEHTVDLACPERDERAAAAKDIAAGAVLIAALGAAAVACVVFLRADAWRDLFDLWREQWWRPTLLGASLIVWAYIVFRK